MSWYLVECPRLMNLFDSFKHVQPIDAHGSNQKKKTRKKRKIYSI